MVCMGDVRDMYRMWGSLGTNQQKGRKECTVHSLSLQSNIGVNVDADTPKVQLSTLHIHGMAIENEEQRE